MYKYYLATRRHPKAFPLNFPLSTSPDVNINSTSSSFFGTLGLPDIRALRRPRAPTFREGKPPTKLFYKEDQIQREYEIESDVDPFHWHKPLLVKDEDLEEDARLSLSLLCARRLSPAQNYTVKSRGESVVVTVPFNIVTTVPAKWKWDGESGEEVGHEDITRVEVTPDSKPPQKTAMKAHSAEQIILVGGLGASPYLDNYLNNTHGYKDQCHAIWQYETVSSQADFSAHDLHTKARDTNHTANWSGAVHKGFMDSTSKSFGTGDYSIGTSETGPNSATSTIARASYGVERYSNLKRIHPSVPVSAEWDAKLGNADGWGNQELEHYTANAENAFNTPEGKLVLRAIANNAAPSPEQRYTSARLVSKQTLQRDKGVLTAVVLSPCAEGIWPAFWLLPQEPFSWPVDGEIDIAETWNGDRENRTCLHWGHHHEPQKHRVLGTKIPDMHSRPVRYDFAWDQQSAGQGRIVWYIDGKAAMKGHWPEGTRPLREFTILLNIAMGGNVCAGKTPADGTYEMVVEKLFLGSEPENGGWARFETDWHNPGIVLGNTY
ncbi:hypothetical protein G7046_g4003 [Stylonectria norvegica]|nr:hypothetical protein G7046_g4003 [Stylonectria norvegica]